MVKNILGCAGNVALLCLFMTSALVAKAQKPVDVTGMDKRTGASAVVNRNVLTVNWPAGKQRQGTLVLDLTDEKPFFKSILLGKTGKQKEIGVGLDPVFLLTVGKRDLVSQNGWNIFFDRPNKRPHQTYTASFKKKKAAVRSQNKRTVITVSDLTAGAFKGAVEITLYHGSSLYNVAAVLSTEQDSTAILYDAGIVSKAQPWKKIAWSDVGEQLQQVDVTPTDTARPVEVKYRTLIATLGSGSFAILPAPHQYFYPLDEAYNLKFTWYGNNYRSMVKGAGIGIRQDPEGDRRWVPWFNAPPGTKQRLNFFCLLDEGDTAATMDVVKQFTHNDAYKPLPGYKTMSSHFHNEYVMNVIMKGKEKPGIPNFVNVFRRSGIDVVHLGEFHYTAHPKGPDSLRLKEMAAMFDMCRRFSSDSFLLLPGEEPNEHFGGHWLAFFPKPVYWIMARNDNKPFVSEDPTFGKVYRIGSKEEMQQLLEAENGLAWTAHARTKGSTGYPDKYKEEAFFKSDHFFGAAWKHIPADLSLPRMGERVLNLMDDMANWGLRKHVIAEADLFTVEPENEMYAHLNVNYLQMDSLPSYGNGWAQVLDRMRNGKFFVSTGEVLLPSFTVNGIPAGDVLKSPATGKAKLDVEIDWTFPLQFAEIITGDGKEVYRQRINLSDTEEFGKKKFQFEADLKGKTWVRLEVWDIAANGAFTQQVWLEP